MKKLIIQTMLVLAGYCVHAQGTLVYDQQVNPLTPTDVYNNIQPDPSGQSFVPTLSSVGFVQLYFTDPGANGLGSTIAVNLWSDSIGTGTLLGTSTSVSMPDLFTGQSTFSFSTPISVTPGTTYFFQPLIQSGDSFEIAVGGMLYANGQAYFQGTAHPNIDMWFREGIVAVPEPSILSLSVLGLAWICAVSRYRRNLKPCFSDPAKEFTYRDFYRLGYAQQCLDGNNLFAAFNFAKVFWVQISLFSEFFLREIGFFAIKANGFSDHFPVPQNYLPPDLLSCHARKIGRQDGEATPATCWFLLVSGWQKRYKHSK